MNFEKLVNSIQTANTHLHYNAVKAVNINITLRNWLVGYYIINFEQNGEDRAKYGTKLLPELAKKIQIKGLTSPELSRCRQFYNTYSNIIGSVTQQLKHLLPETILGTMSQVSEHLPANSILGSLTQELKDPDKEKNEKYFATIISKIPYTHFSELIKIKDFNKRRFYELLVIKNTLSVRELERQIATLTYERVGLSENIELAFEELENKITPANPSDAIKSIYFFDFLNLPKTHLIHENELEGALINHLEKFILELGNGFCFEARQKRLLIDDDYYFVDLVFYHRILKCHILIDLKVDKFKHEHLSQLNSYVGYYKDQVKQVGDNNPIGILLCTEKGNKMVEYALAGMEEKLFVSKYLMELPSKETLAQFIANELKNL
jgi:predicted nuclease of restriction endonuclease-like (RecB) superfamily